MSSRTNDDTTKAAANRLFAKAPNIKVLGKLSEPEIRNLIYPVGFYKTKAKHLKDLAGSLLTRCLIAKIAKVIMPKIPPPHSSI